MSQENKSTFPTLEMILAKYPPQLENIVLKVKGGEDIIIAAQVSRNKEEAIVYVVPESTTYIQRSSKQEAPVQD
ncbi:hypothetical protein HYU92_02480 [Candidatus Curtissbacteria bacterium]|nr:hypothetical protein [Candidatus Curtissbacteria bacterium]